MELQKGMTVWAKKTLKEGEVCPRQIHQIVGQEIYLSKFLYEREFSADELITDEIQALEIALDTRRKQRDDLDKKITCLKKRRVEAIQKKVLSFVKANGKRLEKNLGQEKVKIKTTT